MIKIRVVLDDSCAIASLEASGHAASGPRGLDPVCAATSALIRTAYTVLDAYEGVCMDGKAPEPGKLSFVVRSVDSRFLERVIGVSDFLVEGLSGLERDDPGAVSITLEKLRRH